MSFNKSINRNKMSEHTEVIGDVNYIHLPYRENGFSYCRHCKCYCDKLEICFNEGWLSDWMQVNCGKCHKAIWVSSFIHKSNNKEKDKQGSRVFIKDNEKCEICKKPTNHYDCISYGCFGLYKKGKTTYLCSKKCYKKMDKIEDKLIKEHQGVEK